MIQITQKQKKVLFLFVPLFLIAGSLYIILSTLQNNIVYFKTPTEILDEFTTYPKNTRLRIGGLVKKNTLQRESNTQINFILTDFKNSLSITYKGILPDLFRQGQCVIVEGMFYETTTFYAERILAKHDENYVPRELQESLKEQNQIQYYANCQTG